MKEFVCSLFRPYFFAVYTVNIQLELKESSFDKKMFF